MKTFKLTALAAVAALAAACGYDTHEPPTTKYAAAEATVTIADMKAMAAEGTPFTVTADAAIEGVVTASDAAGNFFRSFVVEDATGAVEVMAGTYDLHVLWPVGRRVSVALAGLAVGRDGDTWQLGCPAATSSWREVDYMAHPALIDRHILRGAMAPKPVPAVVTVGALTADMAGRLVTVRGMTLRGGGKATWATPAADSYTGYPLSKEVAADDAAGGRVWIHTSGYADFAGATVPAGRVSVTGIVAPREGRMRLRMRDIDDVSYEL